MEKKKKQEKERGVVLSLACGWKSNAMWRRNPRNWKTSVGLQCRQHFSPILPTILLTKHAAWLTGSSPLLLRWNFLFFIWNIPKWITTTNPPHLDTPMRKPGRFSQQWMLLTNMLLHVKTSLPCIVRAGVVTAPLTKGHSQAVCPLHHVQYEVHVQCTVHVQ